MAPQTKTVPVSKQFAGPHNASRLHSPAAAEGRQRERYGRLHDPDQVLQSAAARWLDGRHAHEPAGHAVPNVPNILQLATSFSSRVRRTTRSRRLHTFGIRGSRRRTRSSQTKAYAAWRVMEEERVE
jgi:hypothetical protein